ncbi:LysR family transcriptional regulator [Enterococcus sp. LJL120]
MTIQKLEYFVMLAQTLNYSEAAERLFTTQGNVSKQIMALEKELELPLFKREHRQVALTAAGKELLPQADLILKNYRAFLDSAAAFKEAAASKLAIHGIPTMATYHAMEIIGQFHKQEPEIQLHLAEAESYQLFEQLKTDQCDVIVARRFKALEPDWEEVPLAKERFVAVLPKNHPLAQEKQISLKSLESEEFFLLGKSTNIYEAVMALCHKAGFTPKIGYYGRRVEVILNVVANEMGISIMMERAAASFDKNLVAVVPLDSKEYSEVGFMRKKNRGSKSSDLFWEYLHEHLPKNID